MYRLEAGTVTYTTRAGMDRVYIRDVSPEKMRSWQKAMEEFDKVQMEMKEACDKVMLAGKGD